MNNDQIREIREIAIDFRGDGREEGAYAVDVLDQAGALLDRIELDQKPVWGGYEDFSCLLSLIDQELTPAGGIDIPWERVVISGPCVEDQFKAVSVGEEIFLYAADSNLAEWVEGGVDLIPTGDSVELRGKAVTKHALGTAWYGEGEGAKFRLPVRTGADLPADRKLIDLLAHRHKVLRLSDHSAQTAGPAWAPGSEPGRSAILDALGGYLGGIVEFERAEAGAWPAAVLDPMRDREARDKLIGGVAGMFECGAPVDAATYERRVAARMEDYVSGWRERLVSVAAGHLRAEIGLDRRSFGIEGAIPSSRDIASWLDERLGMYAIAPSREELAARPHAIPCRFVLDGGEADRKVYQSIAAVVAGGLSESIEWDPVAAGVFDPYRSCTAQLICKTQGTDLASVVNGSASGPFAETMREAVCKQARATGAPWGPVRMHDSSPEFAIHVSATFGQMETAMLGADAAQRPTVGVAPAGAGALELVVEDCDIMRVVRPVTLERAMEVPASHVGRIVPHGTWDRADAPAPARLVEVGAANRQGKGMKF